MATDSVLSPAATHARYRRPLLVGVAARCGHQDANKLHVDFKYEGTGVREYVYSALLYISTAQPEDGGSTSFVDEGVARCSRISSPLPPLSP